jgi:phosphate:Na+ symporter
LALSLQNSFLALSLGLFSENKIEDQLNKHNILEADDFSMPAVSLANAKREALRMAEVSQNMVVSSLAVMKDDNEMLRHEIIKNEDTVDEFYDSIKLYIARILQEELSPAESQQALNILNFTTNMEHIGDIVNNSLMEISGRKISKHIIFLKKVLVKSYRFMRKSVLTMI